MKNALIVRDGRFYFVQGMEEDYAAQGDTVEEAKSNFLRGLSKTKELQMKRFGETRLGTTSEDLIKELWMEPGAVVWQYGPVTQ